MQLPKMLRNLFKPRAAAITGSQTEHLYPQNGHRAKVIEGLKRAPADLSEMHQRRQTNPWDYMTPADLAGLIRGSKSGKI
jgi:hypothetical protein